MRVCVRVTRVARLPLASLHTPSPYIYRGWGCVVRGAMRRESIFADAIPVLVIVIIE